MKALLSDFRPSLQSVKPVTYHLREMYDCRSTSVKEGMTCCAGVGKRESAAETERKAGLWLSNALAEAYDQVQKYAECGSVCEEILQTWRKHSYTLELWQALFFFIPSKPAHRGHSLVEKWALTSQSAHPQCQCVNFFTQALMLLEKIA